MIRRLMLFGSVVALVWLTAAPEADAARRWRRYRAPQTNTYNAWQRARRATRAPVTYSGVSRAEQDFWRRREAWYDHAYNGWRPEWFR